MSLVAPRSEASTAACVSCSSPAKQSSGHDEFCYKPLAVFEFSVFIENVSREDEKLKQARDEFVAQWGALGTQWGINRTMAQIHALLMTAPLAMTTDEVMEDLEISRGNAHTYIIY